MVIDRRLTRTCAFLALREIHLPTVVPYQKVQTRNVIDVSDPWPEPINGQIDTHVLKLHPGLVGHFTVIVAMLRFTVTFKRRQIVRLDGELSPTEHEYPIRSNREVAAASLVIDREPMKFEESLRLLVL